MGVVPALNKLVGRAEYFNERHGIVTGDRQPAAPIGTVGSKRPDDDEAPGADGSEDSLGIGSAVLGFSQEMKSCAVMPQIIRLRRLPSGHVCRRPVYFRASCAEPCPRCSKRISGKVKYRDSLRSLVKKSVNQPRCATANIDNGCVDIHTGCSNEIKGNFRALLEPTDVALAPGPVDVLPMGLPLDAAHVLFTGAKNTLLTPIW